VRPTVFAELRPVIGRKADALEQAWLVSPPHERAEIEIVAEVLRRQASTRSGVLLDAPDAGNAALADGPVRLGTIVHGRREIGPLGLQLDEIGQHAAIVGRSGSGKSTLAFRVLLELKRLGVPWVLVDFKRSARALRGLEQGRDIDVLSLGRGIGAAPAFNPLVPPPGVPEESHIRLLSEGLAREWYAGDGVISLAERALAEAYASTRPAWPTLAEVELIASEMKLSGREKLWHQSLMRILGQMTRGPLGRLLCTRRDAKALDQLLTGHTIVELDGLANHDANFIAELIVSHVSAALMQGQSREKLRCVIMIDECHRLLAKREGAGERPLELAMRESREIGLGTLLATQSASLLPTSVMANVFTFISMNCRHRADINAASSSLLLREDQKELLSLLPTGEAVARLSARWPHAVHLRVPRLDLPKGEITDADIGEAFLVGRFASLALDGSGRSGDSGDMGRERETRVVFRLDRPRLRNQRRLIPLITHRPMTNGTLIHPHHHPFGTERYQHHENNPEHLP
jgi:DNA helicase HerA-like ATPase